AEAVEAVARGDRRLVRVPDRLPTRERRDQREERRPREMEVREERVHDAETMAGVDEEPRLAGAGGEPAVRGRGLERPDRRRPDGDDASTPRARGDDGRDGLGR